MQTAMDIMNEVPEHFCSKKKRIVECDDSAKDLIGLTFQEVELKWLFNVTINDI